MVNLWVNTGRPCAWPLFLLRDPNLRRGGFIPLYTFPMAFGAVRDFGSRGVSRISRGRGWGVKNKKSRMIQGTKDERIDGKHKNEIKRRNDTNPTRPVLSSNVGHWGNCLLLDNARVRGFPISKSGRVSHIQV